ncbi:MAG: undecaprenyl-diphosphate phosphatase [Alphaproteobacteria bacterium]|nr:undecaprenyl-diphosphate phosphatase [Alphaproteobacteria bacterium]
MPLLHIIVLALVQGVTEFLPISSSGHLVLAHYLMNGGSAIVPETDLTMDIAVHVGTLFAVLLYFRRDAWAMATGLAGLVCGRRGETGQRLFFLVLLSSLPVIAAGFALHMFMPGFLRSLTVMAWATLLFGIVLWLADRFAPMTRTIETMSVKSALLIGLAQVLALIPGTSRSGITMTAARLLGFTRGEAARFSLLLAMVAISGAGFLTGLDLWKSENLALGRDALIAVVLSFFAALGAIALMMRWLERASFAPFAAYRIILGILLLALIYTGTI